jgi:hypothetical protein
MGATLPGRMVRLAVRGAPLAVIEPPFGLGELVEAPCWHPSRTDDPAVRWLLRTLREAARELLPGSGHPPSRPRTRRASSSRKRSSGSCSASPNSSLTCRSR